MTGELELTLKATAGLNIGSRAPGTYTSTAVDVASFEYVYIHAISVLNNGAVGSVALQTSDDSSTGFVSVIGSALPITDSVNGRADYMRRVRTRPLKRYVRLVYVISSGTTLGTGAFLYLFDPMNGADQDAIYQTPV
jgi:hypothetical protein